ncbi:hypothetical protein C8F04DRAFT_1176845 [Mycena alexandri]|uniref:Secreted protein n=1 Tax=Mycena alexandri TaxID=1745969 RepID=A0AAD6XDZ0_9AGAR|nr:hypothetical protein C8F04DRAFT_1176845 [Mycena alexandri]
MCFTAVLHATLPVAAATESLLLRHCGQLHVTPLFAPPISPPAPYPPPSPPPLSSPFPARNYQHRVRPDAVFVIVSPTASRSSYTQGARCVPVCTARGQSPVWAELIRLGGGVSAHADAVRVE